MRTIAILALACATVAPLEAQEITGDWNGILEAQGTQLRLVFHIARSDSGLQATMDSPDQGAMGIAISSTSFTDSRLRLELRRIGAVYEGRVTGETIEGAWRQGVTSIPLVLTREAREKRPPNRPQEPRRPYPYRDQDVTFPNQAAGNTLAGTLTIPDGPGPHPAAVLISGSGPQNRDQEVFGHRTFLVLADHLTRNGIAVLRYDDRGVARSTGNFASATSRDFASDAASAVEYLKTRPDVDHRRIGLIGHSEGGLIAPMVAAESEAVAYVVILAGIGIPGREVSLLQSTTLRPFPVPDEDAYERFTRRTLDIATSDSSLASKRAALTSHHQSIRPVLASLLPKGVEVDAFVAQRVAELTNAWTQFFLSYDPATDLEQVTVPVLSLNGSRDVQVPAEINQAGIRQALERGGNGDFVIKELPGLNHMLQESTTGAMAEYPVIEQTIAPAALNELTAWIKARVGGPPSR